MWRGGADAAVMYRAGSPNEMTQRNALRINSCWRSLSLLHTSLGTHLRSKGFWAIVRATSHYAVPIHK